MSHRNEILFFIFLFFKFGVLDFWNLEKVVDKKSLDYLELYHKYTSSNEKAYIHTRIPLLLKTDLTEMLPKGKSLSSLVNDLLIEYVCQCNRSTNNSVTTHSQTGDSTQNNQNTYITNNYYGDSVDVSKDDTNE